MSLMDHIYLLQHMHDRIARASTGTPSAFAARLGISERKLYRILDELRDMGAVIVYNAERATYMYENEVDLSIRLTIREDSLKRIKGGTFFNKYGPLPFLAVRSHNIVDDNNWESPNP